MRVLDQREPRTRVIRHERTGRVAGYQVDHADGRQDAVVTPETNRFTLHASDYGMTTKQLADLMVALERRYPPRPPKRTASGLYLPGGTT